MKATTPAGICVLLLLLLAFPACDREQLRRFFTGATEPVVMQQSDNCSVKILPARLGRLIGTGRAVRTVLVMGAPGTQFDNDTVVQWESDAIKVLDRRIISSRFMLMTLSLDGSQLDKLAYRVQVGQCQGEIAWQFNRTQHCLTANCLDKIMDCKADAECTGWLDCMMECGDDQMLCPTVCGAFYQSPAISAFTQCGLDSGCIEIDFSQLPACDLPDAAPVAVGAIDGFWWVSAIQGHDYVLYDDCQRFIFTGLNETEIKVENSTYVTYKGETRVVDNIGTYTRTTDGYLELVYENWNGYRELYYPFYATPNVMIMHVCSADLSSASHDYGTLILTRVPLSELGSEEMKQLKTALQNILKTTLEDFRLIGTSGCLNGPQT
ncbi:MAG: hypothetical protein JW832_05995 [Deltaproteobacteria bacterium]|nr:hypothetical protein [Deltaproteobacteria bacterium]